MMDGSKSGNTEPVSTIDAVLIKLVQDTQPMVDEPVDWAKPQLEAALAQLQRICARERLEGRVKEVRRCIKGMGAVAHLMDRAELQERLAELEALQTQLEGKTQ